jgi:hypothetical protein
MSKITVGRHWSEEQSVGEPSPIVSAHRRVDTAEDIRETLSLQEGDWLIICPRTT